MCFCVLLTVLNQLWGKTDKRVERVLDDGSASYLNGERFSTPCSFIVDTDATWRGAMPDIMSMSRSLAIAMLDELELVWWHAMGRASYLFLLCYRLSTLQIRRRPM